MNRDKIDHIISEFGLPKFRRDQLLNAFYTQNVSSYDDISTLGKGLREDISKAVPLMTMTEDTIQRASDKRSYKALLRLSDGQAVETVLIQTKKGLWTTCISSQVGCNVRCSMCATGKLGLLRNLTAEEISDQVLFWYQMAAAGSVPAPPSNVVYMGMGEPFFNMVNLFGSLEELMSPETLNIGSRHISVSTCGVLAGFNSFVERFPQVNLSISLHAANDELRNVLVPVNKKWPLKALSDAVKHYFEATNRKIFFEYVVLDGVNNRAQDFEELSRFFKGIGKRHLIHVNLIPYNDTDSDYRSAPKNKMREFKDALNNAGYTTTIRRSLGNEIQAACGQLAGEDKARPVG